MLKIKFFIAWLACMVSMQLVAQDINVIVGVDSNEVSVGDYIHLTTSITYPTDKYAIVFPNINELYTAPFVIITQTKIDTSQSARTTTLLQTTTIACYDSGLYQLNKLPINGFNTTNDSALNMLADSLLIKVNAVPVNINGDIKDIFTPKQTFNYWKPIAIAAIIIIALFCIIYFLVKYFYRKKNKQTVVVNPYKKTIDALQQLQQFSINNLEDAKQYYSTITDQCKYYLHQRLQLPVLDKTTLQINQTLQSTAATKQFAAPITTVFQLADLVKFAKQHTSAQQNTDALQQAITIVQALEQNYQTQLIQQAANE